MMRGGQRKRVWGILLLGIVQMMSLVSAIGRPFLHESQAQTPHSLYARWEATQGFSSGKRVEGDHVNVDEFKGLGTLGSRPPSCEHKCVGCRPCAAIQVPTTTHHLGLQYANYEPEGWKCKCGASFFNP